MMMVTSSPLNQQFFRAFLLGVTYYFAGKLGLSMPYLGSNITLFWPPSGIATTAFLLWGFSCWPGVFLGALTINLTTGDLTLPIAAMIASGNTLGPLIAAWLLKRVGIIQQQFERSQNVLAFILIGPACMAINASVGSMALLIAQDLSADMLHKAWLGWWLGDTVGLLIMTPPLLTWLQRKPVTSSATKMGWELSLILILCTFLAWLVFGTRFSLGYLNLSLAFLVFPPLIWAGLRFDARGTSLAALIISVIAVWGTAHGNGPFAEGSAQVDQMILCIFVATTALLSSQMIGVQALRCKAKQTLRDSESRLRLALTAANQGLWDLNVQSGAALVSAEYATMLGYEPMNFVETNQRWRERLHPDDREAVYQVYQDYLAGLREDYQVEFRQLTLQGEWKWILSLGKLIEWDAEGQPLRMIGTHTDISASKAREEALQQSQDALNQAQALVKLGSWQLDLQINRLIWSDETFRIFDVKDRKPLSYEQFLDSVIPEVRDFVDRAWQAALKGAPYDIEHRILAAGTLKWVRERAQLSFDREGKLVAALGTVQDISERKLAEVHLHQSQALLRQVIDATPDWIFVKDRQYRFMLVNQAFAHAQGLEPEQMLGVADIEFWSSELCLGDPSKGLLGFHSDDDIALGFCHK